MVGPTTEKDRNSCHEQGGTLHLLSRGSWRYKKEPRYSYISHRRAPGSVVMVARKRAEAPSRTPALQLPRADPGGDGRVGC
jgi:hypothetical protein